MCPGSRFWNIHYAQAHACSICLHLYLRLSSLDHTFTLAVYSHVQGGGGGIEHSPAVLLKVIRAGLHIGATHTWQEHKFARFVSLGITARQKKLRGAKLCHLASGLILVLSLSLLNTHTLTHTHAHFFSRSLPCPFFACLHLACF